MDDGAPRTRSALFALVAATCLVAMNMRPTITAVGPLLDQIGADTGASAATLGLLASVPLAAWALVSPLAHGLTRRFGMSRVVLGALLVLAVGTLVRSLPGPTVGLWAGTVLIGVALAIANVVMPAVVKADFPGAVPLMMAVYTGLLGGFGAIASGVAVPLSLTDVGGDPAGWRVALLITGGALLPPAIVVWWLSARLRRHDPPAPRRAGLGVWGDPVAWVVAAYMGFQAAAFYMQVTWLAAVSMSTGRSEIAAGIDVMIFQIAALAGALTLPLLLRGGAARAVPALLPVVAITGVAGLLVAPGGITVWVVLTGAASGASLGMSLTLMAQRARTSDVATAVSGMAQSAGYVIAAIGPIVFGVVHTLTGGWATSLVVLAGVLVLQLAAGVLAGRDRFVFDRDT